MHLHLGEKIWASLASEPGFDDTVVLWNRCEQADQKMTLTRHGTLSTVH